MRKHGFYTHMNDSDKLAIEFGLPWLAEQIDLMNYGSHRFLSAWVNIRLARLPDDRLAIGVKELLDSGLY